MAPPPERLALDRRRRGVPGCEASAVRTFGAGGAHPAAVRRDDLVAELLEEIAGNSLERRSVGGGHVLAPAPDAGRGWAQKPLLVWLGGNVHGTRVVEHRRVEGDLRERA